MMAAAPEADEAQWDEFLVDSPCISEAVSNFFQFKLAQRLADATSLHAVSRVLLRALNSFEMLTPVEYELENPQGDEQSGMDRLGELGRYKGAYQVLQVVRRRCGKPAKLLGRKFLQVAYEQVKMAVIKDEALLDEQLELLNAFLSDFEKELNTPASAIWSSDFMGSVHRDGELRRQEALKRAEEYKAMERSGADQLLTDVKGMLVQQ